jgi:6-phosphogluconolactonase (cycloisomerase 2 family)
MQGTDDRVHTRGRHGRRWLRVRVTVVSLGFLLPAAAVAATGGALMQEPGTAGCVSAGESGETCLNGNGLLGAGSVAVSPDGQYVYVASFDSSAVTTFVRNTTTGGLSQLSGVAGCVAANGDGVTCGQGRGLNGATWIAISPDGQHLYVASRDSNAVAVFARNPTTGVLTQLSGLAGCIAETGDGVTCSVGVALMGSRTVVVSPDGTSVYLGARDSNAVAVFARNPTTGALTQLSGLAGCVSATSLDGSCTVGLGLLGARGVAVSPDNKYVYVASQDSNAVAVFARDTTTGALTQLSGLAGCIAENGAGGCASGRGLMNPVHVEVSSDGRHVYVASRDSNAVTIFARNVTTGALTQLPGLAGCIAENGDGVTCAVGAGLREAVFLTLSLDGTNLYVASQVSNAVAVFSRNRATGELTQLSGVAGCISENGSDNGIAGQCTNGHGLLGALAVAVSPDGRNAYAASYLSHALTIFTRAVVTHSNEVIIDFGPDYGLWVWQNNSTWRQLHSASAQTLVTGDLDGNGQAEVIIDFGPDYGLWVWQNNSTWRQLHALSAMQMATGNVDGN